MLWLYIAITAYFFSAVNAIIDKVLLVKPIPNATVYAFYIGFLSIFALIFAPFGLALPAFSDLIMDLAAGGVFLLALFVFYSALKEGEASRVVPVIGGLTPIFVFILTYLFLGERLTRPEIFAFFLLALGGVLIFIKKGKVSKKYSIKGFEIAVLAAFLLAVFYVAAKMIFNHQPFISGFVWTRLGSFLGALVILLFPKNRRLIFVNAKTVSAGTGGLLVFNKAIAGVAFILLNYAISLGSVTLVNSLQGLQYFFLLGLVIAFSFKFPKLLEEEISRTALIQKSLGILFIGLGLLILVF